MSKKRSPGEGAGSAARPRPSSAGSSSNAMRPVRRCSTCSRACAARRASVAEPMPAHGRRRPRGQRLHGEDPGRVASRVSCSRRRSATRLRRSSRRRRASHSTDQRQSRSARRDRDRCRRGRRPQRGFEGAADRPVERGDAGIRNRGGGAVAQHDVQPLGLDSLEGGDLLRVRQSWRTTAGFTCRASLASAGSYEKGPRRSAGRRDASRKSATPVQRPSKNVAW